MVDIRGFNGGLNTDASPELLANGDYYYAMNIENTAEGIVNLPGNLVVGNSIPANQGYDWICGSHFDKKRQRIYYFTNNTLCYHRIIAHDITTSQSTVLFTDSPFNQEEFSGNVNMTFVVSPFWKAVRVNALLNITAGVSFTISGTTLNNDGTYTAEFVYKFGGETIIHVGINSAITTGTSSGTLTYRESFDFSQVLNWKQTLKYDPNYVIKDIKIIHREYDGDLIYFIDPNKKLLKFNYNTLLANFNNSPYDGDYFNVIKAPPNNIVSCEVIDLPSISVNNVRNRLFQFKYRFVFIDDEKSVWSAISKVPIPDRSTDDLYGRANDKQNAIRLRFSVGDFSVKKVEVAGRVNIENNWSDFFLIDTIDKQRLSILNDTLYDFDFRNDSVYQPIDIQESNLLFDYVPDEANALELANGNTIVVGGLKDGYNRDTQLNVSLTSTYDNNPALTPSTLSIAVTNASDTGPFVQDATYNAGFNEYTDIVFNTIKFSGTPVAGDVIEFDMGLGAQYTYFLGGKEWVLSTGTYRVVVQPGWTISNIMQAFVDYTPIPQAGYLVDKDYPGSNNGSRPTNPFQIQGGVLKYGSFFKGPFRDSKLWRTHYINITIRRASTFSGNDVFSTYKFSGLYKWGIVYYDKNGKTNGVFTNPLMNRTIDRYSVRNIWGPTLPEPNIVTLNISHTPPSWASYYHIVRTRDLSNDFSLYIISPNFVRDGNYLFLDIHSITATIEKNPELGNVINYGATSFVKGDRVRIVRKLGAHPKDEFNVDMEILSVVARTDSRNYIKIRNIQTSDEPNLSPGQYIIEIYRPPKVLSDKDLVYYEIGERYAILTDDNGNKLHQGDVANQGILNPASIKLDDGDYYYRPRVMVSSTDNNTFDTIYVTDRNFSDTYKSAVWSQGRPIVVDEDIKEEYYPAMLRFSQSYIYGTNINNTNRFYPNNFEESDASFGDILRLKTRENFIRIFQRHKVGMIPIYRQIIIDNANSSQVALSEKLLNKPNYYSGEYGIDKYGTSLISTDYGDYFIDTINKAIVRVSLDGITNISDTNNLMSWSNENIFEDSYGYGCFNYENRNIIMLIGRRIENEDVIENNNNIVAYNEPKKKFESFYGYTQAESILFINGFVYTLLGQNPYLIDFGKNIYIHNNTIRNSFYSNTFNSSISTTFNSNLQLKKTYTAIEQTSTDSWVGTLKTGPLTNQETTITIQDFTKKFGTSPFLFTLSSSLENKFNATIKRNINNGGNKFYGDTMKGLYAQLELTNNSSTEQRLISVSLKYITSPLTNS
jgi:hypothetical protein